MVIEPCCTCEQLSDRRRAEDATALTRGLVPAPGTRVKLLVRGEWVGGTVVATSRPYANVGNFWVRTDEGCRLLRNAYWEGKRWVRA